MKPKPLPPPPAGFCPTLAIDTPTETLSVALQTATGTYAAQADAGQVHSTLLFDMIDSVLQLAHLQREDIGRFVCCKGPG